MNITITYPNGNKTDMVGFNFLCILDHFSTTICRMKRKSIAGIIFCFIHVHVHVHVVVVVVVAHLNIVRTSSSCSLKIVHQKLGNFQGRWKFGKMVSGQWFDVFSGKGNGVCFAGVLICGGTNSSFICVVCII